MMSSMLHDAADGAEYEKIAHAEDGVHSEEASAGPLASRCGGPPGRGRSYRTSESAPFATDDPAAGDVTRTITLSQAMVATVRSIIGPAALYMPHGFASSGTTAGIIVSIVSFVLFVLGVSRLIHCWDWATHNGIHVHTFEGLATKLVSRQLGAFVATSVVSIQAGVCISYFIFVGENFQEVCDTLGGPHVGVSIMAMLMVMLESPLSCIRKIKTLSSVNGAANVLVATSLLVILGFASWRLNKYGVHSGVEQFCPSTLYLFVGTAIFSFEGAVSLTIPIASSVKPEARKQFLSTYVVTVACIAVFYCVYGIVAYLSFGPDVEVIVTMSLPSGIWPGTVVRFLYTVVVLLSFPLQLFPVSESLEQVLFPALGLPFDQHDGNCASGKRSEAAIVEEVGVVHNPINAASWPRGDGDGATDDNAALVGERPSSTARPPARLSFSPLISERVSERVAYAVALTRCNSDAASASTKHIPGNIFRVSLVIIFGLVAIWQRHALDHIIALLGSLFSAPLALVAPAMMHLKLPQSKTSVMLNHFLIGVGMLITIVTTCVTLATWNQAASR